MTIHIPVWLFWTLVIIVIPLVLYLVVLGVIYVKLSFSRNTRLWG